MWFNEKNRTASVTSRRLRNLNLTIIEQFLFHSVLQARLRNKQILELLQSTQLTQDCLYK